jgi:pimeloyl-ACP methyl ester carboxylesterase
MDRTQRTPRPGHGPVEMTWYQLASRPVRTLRAGAPAADAPELVMVPGLGALGYLLPVVRGCGTWTRAHLLDVPGFGHRRTSRLPSTLTDVADVVAEWLATAGPRRVLLFGHSTGAQAAVREVGQASRVRGGRDIGTHEHRVG